MRYIDGIHVDLVIISRKQFDGGVDVYELDIGIAIA